MWRTAERRIARHVCLRHPFRPFHFGIPSIQSLPAAGSWERQYAPPVLHYACIMPIPSLYLQKNEPVSRREATRLVKQLWSPRFVTIQWLCCQLCYVTAANQWRIVEIELLATVGWKWGCQPFSFPCSQNVKHCRKEIYSTCLFKTSFRPFHFRIPSIQSLPAAGSWERQYAPPVLHYACIMPIPSLYLQKKEPVSCREATRLVKQLWSPRFVTIQWLCCQLCYVTAANQWRIVEIELLATVGWKWGCQPFSCPCSQNVKHCRKEIYSTCLFKTSIPAVPFSNSKHPVSTRSRFLRGTVRSTSSALCLHHAHPFVVSAEKRTSFMQRSKAFGQAVVVSKICHNTVIVLSCDCCKPMKNCRDWAFSNSWFEVGLPAFQLHMFAKCEALPKGDLLDMLFV